MRSRWGPALCGALGVAGLALSGYLGFLHLALLRGELLGGRLCGDVGSIFNCHAVSFSQYSQLWGLPLAFWGMIGYVAALSLALIAWQLADSRKVALIALVGLSLIFLLVDAMLLIIMVTRIKYLCALCLGTYAINFLLLGAAKWSTAQSWSQILRGVPGCGKRFLIPRSAEALFFWWMVVVGSAGIIGINFAGEFMLRAQPGAIPGRIAQQLRISPRLPEEVFDQLAWGLPETKFRVVEFTDFLCPACHDASKFNVINLAHRPNDISLRMRHYPLDQACNDYVKRTSHPGACTLAAATECAREQGRFWALHDRIFEVGPMYRVADLEHDAIRAGVDMPAFRRCMASGRGMDAVKRDIEMASRLGVQSTPSYVINRALIGGLITPAVFAEIVEALEAQGEIE